jgi:hypothetical protein
MFMFRKLVSFETTLGMVLKIFKVGYGKISYLWLLLDFVDLDFVTLCPNFRFYT